jgi:DNA-binding transcriptional regulator YhcF (GntR family)
LIYECKKHWEQLFMQAVKVKKDKGLPKYLELRGRLLEDLSADKFNPEDRFYTEAQVSRNHNIALMTVRRTYEILEKEGFIRREHGSGTYVSKVPDKVIRQKIVQTCMVGIYLSSQRTIDGFLHGIYLETLSLALKNCGMATTIIFDDPEAIPAESLDGLIYLGEDSKNEIKAIRKLNLPTVSLGKNRIEFFSGVCQKKDFIYNVFMHFLRKGRRKIALLNFTGDLHCNDRFFTHLNKAITDFGAGESLEITNSLENLQCELEESLSKDDRPDAIWISNWSFLPGIMLALQKLRLEIGRDIGIFVNSSPEFGLKTMPAHAQNEIGSQAGQVVNMLAKMIKKPNYKGNVIENEPIIINKEAF